MKKSTLMYALIAMLLAVGNLIGGISGTLLILAALMIAIALLFLALGEWRSLEKDKKKKGEKKK